MKVITKNKRAYFDYFILEKFMAGIVLVGSEVKSIRSGHISLEQSFVTIRSGEVFLKNAYIKTYECSSAFTVDERRDRKLLLNKSEILKLESKLNVSGQTLIPLDVVLEKGLVKVNIALCKGKKTYDKKDSIKQKDIKRDTDREIKQKFNA